MDHANLAKDIIKAGQSKDFERLEEIITKCETKVVSLASCTIVAINLFDSIRFQLVKTAVECVGRADMTVFWNFLLCGFKCNADATANKRFAVIISVLHQINKTEVTSKQCFELITRLFIELPKLSSGQLVELSQYCIESLRTGDPKCTG